MTGLADDSRALVDTNILVYAYDLDDPSKHAVARQLIERLSDQSLLVFSTQVCNEFCSVMMRPSRSTRCHSRRTARDSPRAGRTR